MIQQLLIVSGKHIKFQSFYYKVNGKKKKFLKLRPQAEADWSTKPIYGTCTFRNNSKNFRPIYVQKKQNTTTLENPHKPK